MNDALAERLCIALEQLALELAQANEKGTVPAPVFRAVQQPATVMAPQAYSPAPQSSPEYQPIGWTCPVHGGMKIVPAGTSQRTGQPYQAFVACPERGCNEKPGRLPVPAPARAVPPSQLP